MSNFEKMMLYTNNLSSFEKALHENSPQQYELIERPHYVAPAGRSKVKQSKARSRSQARGAVATGEPGILPLEFRITGSRQRSRQRRQVQATLDAVKRQVQPDMTMFDVEMKRSSLSSNATPHAPARRHPVPEGTDAAEALQEALAVNSFLNQRQLEAPGDRRGSLPAGDMASLKPGLSTNRQVAQFMANTDKQLAPLTPAVLARGQPVANQIEIVKDQQPKSSMPLDTHQYIEKRLEEMQRMIQTKLEGTTPLAGAEGRVPGASRTGGFGSSYRGQPFEPASSIASFASGPMRIGGLARRIQSKNVAE